MEQFDLFGGLEKLGFTVRPKTDELYKKDEVDKKGTRSASANKEIKPEDFLFMRKVNCPVCMSDFENTTIRTTKLKLIRSDTDLRSYYEPFDPLLYDVIVCSKCGYSAMNSMFKAISDKQSDLILNNVSKSFKAQNYPLVYSLDDAAERYKLALLCSVVKNGKNSEKAMLCLKLAWLMREKKEEQLEKFYIQNAFTGFMEAFEKENLPVFGIDENTLNYLLGDLCRRLGNYDDALRFIGKVIVSRQANKRIKDRAITVRDLIREEKKAEEAKAQAQSQSQSQSQSQAQTQPSPQANPANKKQEVKKS